MKDISQNDDYRLSCSENSEIDKLTINKLKTNQMKYLNEIYLTFTSWVNNWKFPRNLF